MPTIARCKCGKQLRVRDELAGKKVKCPGCGGVVPIPSGKVQTPAKPNAPPKRKAPATPELSRKAQSKLLRPDPPDRSGDDAVQIWTEPDVSGWYTFIALTEEEICFANFDKKERKRARLAFQEGDCAADVLGDDGKIIELQSIRKLSLNKRSTDLSIAYDKEDEATLHFNDAAPRDQVFKALRSRLGPEWKLSKRELSRVVMSLWTLLATAIFITLTTLFYLGAEQGDDGAGRKVKEKIFVWVLNLLGPTGVLIVGGLLVAATLAWLVRIWMLPPPLMVELEPA